VLPTARPRRARPIAFSEQLQAIRAEIFRQVSPINGRRLLTDVQVSALLADDSWRAQRLAQVTTKGIAVRRTPIKL